MIHTILVGSGLIHPGPLARWRLRHVLESITGVSIDKRSSLETMTTMDYAHTQLVVLYFQEQQLSIKAWERIKLYVTEGGTLLVIHAGTASFKAFDPWFDFIGGRFVGHGPIRRITIQPQQQTALLSKLGSFTVIEELYHHEIHGRVEIHATAIDEAGTHPVVWTKLHKHGRVAYVVFGHRASAFRNEGVQDIISRLVYWLTENNYA